MNDNKVIPVSEVRPEDLNKQYSHDSRHCSGCGKPNPAYFSIMWQLYVCGADTCKPYNIAYEIAHHAMTGN